MPLPIGGHPGLQVWRGVGLRSVQLAHTRQKGPKSRMHAWSMHAPRRALASWTPVTTAPPPREYTRARRERALRAVDVEAH